MTVFRWSVVLALATGLACRWGEPVEADLVIRDVTVIDGTDGPARPNMAVAVKGDRIVAVRPSSEVMASEGAVTIDGRGKYLIPGLWDMHVHLPRNAERSFPLFLANGVTMIRDMGGDPALALWLRQETRYGRMLGPEMLIAGPVLDSPYIVRAVSGSLYAAGRAAAPDSATAVALVDSLARLGVDHLKVHSMTPRAAYFAILAEGAKRGIPVVGHIPDSVMPDEAIKGGQRTVEHNTRVELAESGRAREISAWLLAAYQRVVSATGDRPRLDRIIPLRLAADDSARASFDPGAAAAFAELAAKSEVWFDPTFVVLELVHLVNEPGNRDRPELKYLPESAREMDEGLQPDPNASEAEITEGRRKFERALAAIEPLRRAGVKFVAGTDTPVWPLAPGFALHRELGHLVRAGLTPAQAIQAATRNAADAAGRLDQSGTVEEGKTASLVLLDADPLADIANTSSVHAVISRGRLLDRGTLDRMLADAEAFAERR